MTWPEAFSASVVALSVFGFFAFALHVGTRK